MTPDSRITACAQIFLGLLLWFLQVDSSWAQILQSGSQSSNEPINVTADKLSAGDGGSKIEASGNVEIKRQLTTLKAQDVSVNRETQDVEAKGKVSLDDPEWKIKSADSVQMNLQKETGEIQNGDLFIEQGHLTLSGRRFQKFVGQSYHVDEGFFTTCLCDSGPSPWRISGDSVDLRPDGVGTIRGGYFYILDVPVFYLPYGFFPVKTERQSGLLVPKIGQSTTDGFRYLQPFFWAISKSADSTIAADFESRSRWGFLGELRTIINRDSDFQLNGSYFNEQLRTKEERAVGDNTIADQNIPINRWNVIGSHRYLTTTNWLTYSDIAAYGDDLFTRELIDRSDLPAQNQGDIRESRFAASRFGVFRGWGDTFLKGEWSFYQDFIQPDSTTFQRTPQIAFWGRRLMQDFPLEFRWRAEGVNYWGARECSSVIQSCIGAKTGDGLRLDLRPELVFPFKPTPYLFGGLSIAPRETVYHLYSLARTDRNISRELVEIRGNIGTSVSRVFAFAGEYLKGIKHVVEPELSYLFVPGVNQRQIPIMDFTDRINRRNVLTLSLTNRVLGKFGSGSPLAVAPSDQTVEVLNPVVAGDVRELGSLRLALSYDINQERKGGDTLSDLDINLRLMPLYYLAIGFDGGVNPGAWQVTQARATFGISDPRPLRPVLDPDFNRPNSLFASYQFLRQGPNGLLAENANINLDAPPNCPNTLDPRCTGFKKDIVGQVGGGLVYHVHDQVMVLLSATYDVRDNRFPGYHGAVKFLSGCECWSITLSLNREINPAKTSFNFNFNLLGLGAQKNTLN